MYQRCCSVSVCSVLLPALSRVVLAFLLALLAVSDSLLRCMRVCVCAARPALRSLTFVSKCPPLHLLALHTSLEDIILSVPSAAMESAQSMHEFSDQLGK